MYDQESSTLGVVPIWRKLKDKYQESISLGVLCGSLILLPKNTEEMLQRLIWENGIAEDAITLDHFGGDGN